MQQHRCGDDRLFLCVQAHEARQDSVSPGQRAETDAQRGGIQKGGTEMKGVDKVVDKAAAVKTAAAFF